MVLRVAHCKVEVSGLVGGWPQVPPLGEGLLTGQNVPEGSTAPSIVMTGQHRTLLVLFPWREQLRVVPLVQCSERMDAGGMAWSWVLSCPGCARGACGLYRARSAPL